MNINEVSYTDNPDVARSGEAFWFDNNKGYGLVDEIWIERRGQIEMGYDSKHDDDEHEIEELITWGTDYATGCNTHLLGNFNRANIIKGIALLVAAVETLDRKEES